MERNSSNMYGKGSEKATVREVTSAGASPQALQCLPYIASSKWGYEKPMEDNFSEGGVNYPTAGNVKADCEFTFMQRDKATLMFPLDAEGKYYQVVKQMNEEPINGKYNFLVAPIVKFTTKVDISSPSKTYPVPFTLYPTTALLCVDLTGHASTGHGYPIALTCTTLAFASGTYYTIYEQASS